MTGTAQNTHKQPKSNARVAFIAGLIAALMVGMSFAAVPLYRVFCQVTGFSGTPLRATSAPANSGNDMLPAKEISVRFDSNVRDMPWEFKPAQRVMKVRVGEQAIAYYRAKNLSDKPITGTAVFNVSPNTTGEYFNKIECFCFTEQTLEPGEAMDMPVVFFVDRSIMDDDYDRHVSEITLSYTFFPSVKDERTGAKA